MKFLNQFLAQYENSPTDITLLKDVLREAAPEIPSEYALLERLQRHVAPEYGDSDSD